MSCSEYLVRYQQRLPKYVDTRPRYKDASQFTDITKRTAAAGNLETARSATACTYSLGMQITPSIPQYYNGGGHNVQDASDFLSYTSGQAQAQSTQLKNQKALPSIQLPCFNSTAIPEFNDRLANDTNLASIQAQKNQFQRGWNTASCCIVCGQPPKFASGCNCRLTGAQIYALKRGGTAPLHTIEPNVNVA
jgi:hypothetical protein